MVLLVAGCAALCTVPVHSIKFPGSIQSILSEILSETCKCKWPVTIVFGTGLLSIVIKICVTTFSCCLWNYCSWNEIKATDSDCIVHVHLPVEKLARKISKKKRTVKFPTKFKAVNHLPLMVRMFKLMKSVSLLCLVVVAVVLVPVADAGAGWLDLTQYKDTAIQMTTARKTAQNKASHAVDGNSNTATKSNNKKEYEWWSIELGEERTVTEVTMTISMGNDQAHINGAKVFVGDDLDTSYPNANADGTQCGSAISGVTKTGSAGPFSFVCDPPITGRMVKIFSRKSWADIDGKNFHFGLKEVKVKCNDCGAATCAQKTDGTIGGSFSCAVGTRLKSNPGNIECGAAPCAATENALCCNQNVCTCTKGVVATGTACTSHSSHICISCDTGFSKDGDSCTLISCDAGKYKTGNK